MSKDEHQLPKVAFSILLALSLRERHGYEIIKQVEEDSSGRMKLGPGALYTSIKQLLKRGLINEVKHKSSNRRRYYELSAQGQRALESEMEYYENAVALSKKRQKLNPTKNNAAA